MKELKHGLISEDQNTLQVGDYVMKVTKASCISLASCPSTTAATAAAVLEVVVVFTAVAGLITVYALGEHWGSTGGAVDKRSPPSSMTRVRFPVDNHSLQFSTLNQLPPTFTLYRELYGEFEITLVTVLAAAGKGSSGDGAGRGRRRGSVVIGVVVMTCRSGGGDSSSKGGRG